MKAVQLNRQLELETEVSAADGAGGYVSSWSTVGTLWAEIQPGSGREVPGEELALSMVSCRIIVRGAPPGAPSRPRPDQRFRSGTRLFNILAVTERDPRGHYLTCFAKEESPT